MTDTSNVEQVRQLLRKLQTMLFDPQIEKKDLFPITLDMDKLLDKSAVEINKLLNEQ